MDSNALNLHKYMVYSVDFAISIFQLGEQLVTQNAELNGIQSWSILGFK